MLLCEKVTIQSHTLYYSNYMTFQKRQHREDRKQWFAGEQKESIARQRTDLEDSETAMHDDEG